MHILGKKTQAEAIFLLWVKAALMRVMSYCVTLFFNIQQNYVKMLYIWATTIPSGHAGVTDSFKPIKLLDIFLINNCITQLQLILNL